MMLANLPGLLADAADAAETYVAEARRALAPRVAVGGRLDRETLDREQHVAHGLAWAAAYAETLRQTAPGRTTCRPMAVWARPRPCLPSFWRSSI